MKSLKPQIKITTEGPYFNCKLYWTGVKLDRPNTSSIQISDKNLALRYKKAVEAGRIYSDPEILKDICGKTYVSYEGCVIPKYLESELDSIGF